MFQQGQQIGSYKLLRKLGRGGFGEVWLAEKRSQFVTKKVAVKLPLDDQVNFEAIRQEAELWEQASGNANVLPIIDADVIDGQVVIVSEYADGGSLHDKLRNEGKLPIKQAVEIAIGILNGLEFLHYRKIIHRDIKPQNVLLQGNTPRLADFGISRAMQTTSISSKLVGTDAYMSPEAFDGKRSVQTDIWSVGVVLYQLLAGSLPFPQEHPSERIFAILTKEFPPLPNEIPQSLRNIVGKALAKQPENRYQTASEMREALQQALMVIEHPTMAKTEVLQIPVSSETILDTNFSNQTVTDVTNIQQLFRTEEPKKETVVNHPPLSPETHKITEKAFKTDEPKKETVINPPPITNSQSASAGKRNLMIALIGGGAIVLLFGAVLSGLAVKYFFFPKYPPIMQRGIDKAKKENPYFIYSDREPFKDNEKYGYRNYDDKIVIPAKYEEAHYFSEGLGLVKLDGKWGFIDENGKTVVPIKYDSASHFRENLAAVELNDKWGFVDTSGKEVIPFKYESEGYGFHEGLDNVKLNGKWGFIDRKGNEVIPFKYDTAYYFSESLAAVESDDKWGFIDKNGNTVIPFKYEDAGIFSQGLASAKLNDKYGFIDKTGKEIIPFKFGYISSFERFDEGLAEACLNKLTEGGCGLIDTTGKEIVPFKYKYVRQFNEGLVAVGKDDKWGFVDKNGIEVIPLRYDSVGNFSEGLAAVERDGKVGFIDKNGVEVISPKYDALAKYYDGNNAEVERNGRRFRIDKNGGETDIGTARIPPPTPTVSNTNSSSNTASTNTAANTATNTASNTSAANSSNTTSSNSASNIASNTISSSPTSPEMNLEFTATAPVAFFLTLDGGKEDAIILAPTIVKKFSPQKSFLINYSPTKSNIIQLKINGKSILLSNKNSGEMTLIKVTKDDLNQILQSGRLEP